MSKGGDDNREQRAQIRQAAREGKDAGVRLSTGAQRQLDHADQEQALQELHAEKGKS